MIHHISHIKNENDRINLKQIVKDNGTDKFVLFSFEESIQRNIYK